MAKHLPSNWHRPFLMESGVARLMDDVFSGFGDVGFAISPIIGKSDIYEQDNRIIYEIELPGVTKDEIEIKVEDDRLTISGEIKRNEEIKRDNYFRIGRRYGRFHQSLLLPADVEKEAEISASLANGILKVAVPLNRSIKEHANPITVRVT